MALLRGEDGRVGFAELFFDLVFVFAITQISHYLLYHYNLSGAIEALILFLAVWWVWIYTTWVLNRLDPDKPAVRGLLFGLMLGGLFMSMAIPAAFHGRGIIFAFAFVAMQVGRTVFVWVAARGTPVLRMTYLRILLWFLGSSLFWLSGGLTHDQTRLALWGMALAIEYLGPVVGYRVPGLGRDVTGNWAVKGGHIAERCGLFVIICLGETLLISGATFSELPWDMPGMLAFLSSVAGAVGMWWVYFHIGHRRGTHMIEASDDPGRLARLAFTYVHIPIVAGIVLGAVGSERAIAHPGDAGVLVEGASIIGGLVLFLVGNGWFKTISGGVFPLSHIFGLGLCAVALMGGPVMPLWSLNTVAAAILLVVAVWEDRSLASHTA